MSFEVDETTVDYKSLKQSLKFEEVNGNLTMPSLKAITATGRFRGDDERGEFMFAIRVTAISDNGKGYEASQVFIGCPKADTIKIYDGKDSYDNKLSVQVGDTVTYELKGHYIEGNGGDDTLFAAGFTVKSSDPSKVSAYYDEKNGKLVLTGHKAGKEAVTVTCTLRDGSGKNIKIKVTVNK